MIKREATCGQEAKSDCIVTVQPSDTLEIVVKSKLQKLYGKAIQKTAEEMAEKLGVEKGKILINDCGALDWVLRARIECAIKRAEEEA